MVTAGEEVGQWGGVDTGDCVVAEEHSGGWDEENSEEEEDLLACVKVLVWAGKVGIPGGRRWKSHLDCPY